MRIDTKVALSVEMLQKAIAEIFLHSEWYYSFDRVVTSGQLFFLIYNKEPVVAMGFQNVFAFGRNYTIIFVWDAYLRLLPNGDRIIDFDTYELHLATHPEIIDKFLKEFDRSKDKINIQWSTMMVQYHESLC